MHPNISILVYAGVEALNHASFGEGSGRIWLTNISCSGNERSLVNCHISSEVTSCTHAQDAGIRCSQGELTILVSRIVDYLSVVV